MLSYKCFVLNNNNLQKKTIKESTNVLSYFFPFFFFFTVHPFTYTENTHIIKHKENL